MPHHTQPLDARWFLYGGIAALIVGYFVWKRIFNSERANAAALYAGDLFFIGIVLGIASVGIGFLGGYLGILPRPIPFWFVIGGIALMVGSRLIKENWHYVPPPTPPPVPAPVRKPSRQTVYGDARPATDQEIHDALRDKEPSRNSGYLYED